MSYKYIRFAWATAGDQGATIPDDTVPAGTLSWQAGWPGRYQLPYPSDVNALPIDRSEMNQILFDISTAVQDYQNFATPPFITAALNGGVPYAYVKNAYAAFDAGDGNGVQIYQSNTSLNTDSPTPGGGDPLPAAGWDLKDDNVSSNVLNHVNFEGSVVTGNVVYYNSISGLFEKAISNGTQAQSFIGIADVARGRIVTFGVYKYYTGLTAGATYYLSDAVYGALTTVQPSFYVVPVGVAISSTEFMILPGYGGRFAPSSSIVLPGTIILWGAPTVPTGYLYCDGSAISRTTYSSLFANVGTTWGVGDGSTTFNLPDCRRMFLMGDGGVIPGGTTLNFNTVGKGGGEEMHAITIAQMPSHNHPGSYVPYGENGGARVSVANGMNQFPPPQNVYPLTITSQGGNQPLCLLPPTKIIRYLMKY